MRLELVSTGAVTAVGHTAPVTQASVWARLSRFRETHVVGVRGTPVVAAMVLPSDAQLSGAERALALARPAIAECLASAHLSAQQLTETTGLIVCGPMRHSQLLPALPLPLSIPLCELDESTRSIRHHLRELVRERHGVEVPDELLSAMRPGHASFALALQRAAELLDAARARQCLVVGVDSPCHPPSLEWLDLLGYVASSRWHLSQGTWGDGPQAMKERFRTALRPGGG